MWKLKQWKTAKILAVILTLTLVQGCTLAKVGNNLNEAQDKLIGAWVILGYPGIDSDSQISLEDFKKDDAHVIYLEDYIKDDAQSLEIKTSGNIYGDSTNLHLSDSSRGTEVTAKVYFTSSSPELIKLYPIYEKANGERYALRQNTWMMVGTEDNIGSLGSTNISAQYTKIENGKKIEEEVSFDVDFARTDTLIEAKILHLDKNYSVLFEEKLDLQNIMDHDEPIPYTVKDEVQMIIVEETFKSPKELTLNIVRTIYSPGPESQEIVLEQGFEDTIFHDFILPIENNLAKKVTMNFCFSK